MNQLNLSKLVHYFLASTYATGGGAIAGVPINIASGAVVLGGGIVLKRSAGNLGDDLMSLIKGGNGENVRGTGEAVNIPKSVERQVKSLHQKHERGMIKQLKH
jgi:hypothetical protein